MNPAERVQKEREKIQKEINGLNLELKELDKKAIYATQLTELCPDCKGSGEERYTDAAGSGDWRDCSTCHGWGYIPKGLTCPQCNKPLDDMRHLRRQHMPCCPYCGVYLGNLFYAVPE